MLGLQLGLSFVAWIACGMWRWSALRKRPRTSSSRNQAIAWGAAALFGSAIALFAGLLGLERLHAIQNGALTGWGWVLATVLGALFVTLQVGAVDCLLGLVYPDVTSATPPASDSTGKKETE